MTCEESKRPALSGYADGELSAEERRWWDDHLRNCASCRQELERLRALRATLKSHLPTWEPSPELRRDVQQLLGSELPGRNPSLAAWRRWGMSLAASVLFALGLGTGYLASSGGAGEALVAQVVAGHVRSLEVDHLVDVASSEHHVVKPWFAGKLDFSPPVPDLAAAGFPLLGGRVDYLEHRPAAALVYGKGPHRVNVFVWPSGSNSACELDRPLVQQGFNLVHGRAAGMELWAVSDLNPQELTELARRYERAADPRCAAAGGTD